MRSLAQRRNRHGAIHATRKAIRRLRSILALCRQALEPEVSDIDRALRHLGTGLSDLRDAHVVTTTALQLATGDERDLWLAAATHLAARREALLAEALAKDPEFFARRAKLNALAEAIAALSWDRLTHKDLSEGIARSARRLTKAKQAEHREPNVANSHRLRRRLRRLRMQRQAIQAARREAPSLIGSVQTERYPSVRTLTKDADHLGLLQDLKMLRSCLKWIDTSLPMAQMRSRLRSELDRASP